MIDDLSEENNDNMDWFTSSNNPDEAPIHFIY
jgi:hypothetical protein